MPGFIDIGPRQTLLLDIGPLQSVGILTLTVSLSDSLTFADSSTFVGPPDLHLLLNDSQAGNWSDLLIFPGAVFPLTFNDTLSFSDNFIGTTIQPALLIQDALAFSDALFSGFPLVLLFNDSFTISDLLTLINLFVVNENLPTDGYNIQDQIILNLATVISFTPSDALSFSDSMQDVLSIPLTLVDNIKNWDDLLILGSTQNVGIFVEDFLLFLDALFQRTLSLYVFNDALSINDLIALATSNTVENEGLGDSYVVSDSLLFSIGAPLNVALADSVNNFSDAFVVSLPEPLNNYLRRYLNDVVN